MGQPVVSWSKWVSGMNFLYGQMPFLLLIRGSSHRIYLFFFHWLMKEGISRPDTGSLSPLPAIHITDMLCIRQKRVSSKWKYRHIVSLNTGLAVDYKLTQQYNYYQVVQQCRRQCIASYMNLLWSDRSQLRNMTVKTSNIYNQQLNTTSNSAIAEGPRDALKVICNGFSQNWWRSSFQLLTTI